MKAWNGREIADLAVEGLETARMETTYRFTKLLRE